MHPFHNLLVCQLFSWIMSTKLALILCLRCINWLFTLIIDCNNDHILPFVSERITLAAVMDDAELKVQRRMSAL